MALPWVRLDTGFPHNPKVLALVAKKEWRAITVYISGLAYAGQHGTDGFIPKAAMPLMHGTTKDGNALVEARLWEHTEGGYLIPDWSEYQVTKDVSDARRESARKAARARWSSDLNPKGRGVK